MSRMLWFAAGAASGVYTLAKARRAVQNFTPDGVGARLAAWNVGAKMFKDEVAAGMAEREHELRAQLNLGGTQGRLLEMSGHARTPRATPAAAAASDPPRAS